MKRKLITIILIALSVTMILSSCTTSNPNVDTSVLEGQIKEKDTKINKLEADIKALKDDIKVLEEQASNQPLPPPPTPPTPMGMLPTGMSIIDSIKNQDMNVLSTYVHPTLGVRFTPYEHIDLQNDKVFTAQEVTNLMTNTQVYNWGTQDGSGDPINFKFSDYYNEYVYDEDFANPHMIGNNVAIGNGNMINNMATAYPNAEFVEFHFTGFDPQFAGMDWGSLRLVFEDVGGIWYLVGIVHGQWTT